MSFLKWLKIASVRFFIGGSAFHLWYFPALFCTIFIFAFLHKTKMLKAGLVFSLIFFIIGVLQSSYLPYVSQIPVVGTVFKFEYFYLIRRYFCLAFPFFMAGSFLNISLPAISGLKPSFFTALLVLFTCLFLAECCFIIICLKKSVAPDMTLFLYPMIILIFTWALHHPKRELVRFGALARKMAVFIYCVHVLFMILYTAIKGELVYGTPLFLFVFFASTLAAYIAVKADNKILNKLIS